MDHSIEGYLSRMSDQQLECFLVWLLKTESWDSYAYVIPEIARLFQSRKHTPSQAIQNALDQNEGILNSRQPLKTLF